MVRLLSQNRCLLEAHEQPHLPTFRIILLEQECPSMRPQIMAKVLCQAVIDEIAQEENTIFVVHVKFLLCQFFSY